MTGLIVEEIPPVLGSRSTPGKGLPSSFPIISKDIANKIVEAVLIDEKLARSIAELYRKFSILAVSESREEERADVEQALKLLFIKNIEGFVQSGTVTIHRLDKDSWLVNISIPEEGLNAYAYVQGTLSLLRALEAAFKKILERRGLAGKYVTLLDIAHEIAEKLRKLELESIRLRPKPITKPVQLEKVPAS